MCLTTVYNIRPPFWHSSFWRCRETRKDFTFLTSEGPSARTISKNLQILRRLSETTVAWSVVERPGIADLGTKHFANESLKFFPSLDDAIHRPDGTADSFLFSGSLQCLESPFSFLDRVIASGAQILAFDRLLVSSTSRHALYIQRPDPRIYYSATYPAWCFSIDLFRREMTSRGFELVEHFPADADAQFDHCGMIFVRLP